MPSEAIDWNEVTRDLGRGLLSYFGADFPRPVAADLVQEVLLRLYRKVEAGEFDRGKGTLRAFAFGVARFARQEELRRQRIAASHTDVDTMSDELAASGDITSERDRATMLRRAIAKLKPIEQEVILLLLDQDLSISEIGVVLDLPDGTVKSHIFRAKQTLKNLLKD